MNSRCCARCRTPYNCGNPGCTCHPADPRVAAEADRITRESRTTRQNYDVDFRRGHRDPDMIPGAEK